MERLTYKSENDGNWYFKDGILKSGMNRLAAYEDTGLEPEDVAKLAQDQQDGLLLKLPCKLGTTVYVVGYDCLDRPAWVTETNFTLSLLDSFGKTVFPTRAEAEAVMGGDTDAR